MADSPREVKLDKLRALRADYGRSLPERLGALRHCWHTAAAAETWNTALADMLQLAHSLSGSAGTFGYVILGAQAKQLEDLLTDLARKAVAPSTEQKAVIADALNSLWQIQAAGPDDEQAFRFLASPDDSSGEQKTVNCRVALVEDDPLQAQEMAGQLSLLGWDVTVYGSTSEAAAMAQGPAPAALIVDVGMPEGPLAGIDFMRKVLAQTFLSLPYVVISARWDWESRLAAVRSGAGAYLAKPVDIATLADHLDRITLRHAPEPYRVLVIDDDPALVSHYTQTLAAASMASLGVTQASMLLDAISQHQPELVLMDLYMPDCNGIEATQVIRQDPQYASLPIVFLTTESGLLQEQQAFRTGADDFLRKPISDAELIFAVSIRAERFRALTALVRQDSMTGLYNHLSFKLHLDGEMDRSRRSGKPLSVIMLDIDHFKYVNDTYGHPQGDRVIKSLAHLLRKRLRKSDVIGRYGGEEFAVAMPDTRVELAASILDELREQFRQLRYTTHQGGFACTFSAGVAKCKTLDSVDSVLKAADQALYQAKKSGRNRVECPD